MAASKAPKHDFAPAWLKIPASDNGRPKGYDSDRRSGNKRGDYYGPPGPPDYGYQLQKQRSLDQYHDGRYNSGKHRHHSADEEFYSPPYPGVPYYNSYNGFEKYGSQYRSQPALFRPQGRDKYPPPPPPPGRFGQVNGMYPPYPYGDPYFEFFPPEPYYQAPFGRPHTSGGGGGKRYHHTERDKDKYTKPDKADKEKKKEIDDDFPTLKSEGDKNDSKSGKPASGVWDKPLKVNTTQSSNESPQPSPDISKEKTTQNSTNNSIYKALVPNKGVLNRKPSKDSLKNGPLPSGSGNLKPSTPTSTTPGPTFKVNGKQTVPVILTKEGTRQSPTPSTPPMDILNSQLVTQPRRLGDKKSNFLRQLKKDKSPEKKESDKNWTQVNGDANSHEQNQLANGVDSMHLSAEEEKALSSSLEAEHRLLREMGWNEEDYEECEITEDERKEMERLQSELKQQRNCQRRTLPKTLSPQHLPSFVPPQDLSETLSSDSESDLD